MIRRLPVTDTESSGAEPSVTPEWTIGYTVLYVAVIGLFLMSAIQFYDRETGFTYLIGFAAPYHEWEIPAVRETQHYDHPDSGGYDGQFYAQLAVEPLLRDPAIDRAIDLVPYRARRILLPWVAHILGLGRPSWILQAYAVQNVVSWVLLAVLLVHWLPPVSLRNFAAWFGCLFGYGSIVSVRYALVDGPSMLLIAMTVVLIQKRRTLAGAALLGLSGLAKETNLLGAVAFLRRELLTWMRGGHGRDTPRRTAGRMRTLPACILLIIAPLALWQDYLRSIYRSTAFVGGEHLTTPLTAYVAKWAMTLGELSHLGWASYASFSLLALVSLSVQAAYLASRRQLDSPWWRLGTMYAVLMFLLAPEVWEGHPGAMPRIVMPLSIAFNLLLPTGAVFWPWWLAGNLTMLQALLELRLLSIPWL